MVFLTSFWNWPPTPNFYLKSLRELKTFITFSIYISARGVYFWLLVRLGFFWVCALFLFIFLCLGRMFAFLTTKKTQQTTNQKCLQTLIWRQKVSSVLLLPFLLKAVYLNFTKHPEITRCLHSHSAEGNKQNLDDNCVLFTPCTQTLTEHFAGRIKEECPSSQLTGFPITFWQRSWPSWRWFGYSGFWRAKWIIQHSARLVSRDLLEPLATHEQSYAERSNFLISYNRVKKSPLNHKGLERKLVYDLNWSKLWQISV